MKSFFIFLMITIPFLACNSQQQISGDPEQTAVQAKGDIYQFKVEDLFGAEFDFSSLKGKKVMIVNTASKCGNTPQYEGLQRIYTKYGPDNFVVVGFPANNFLKQEPGTNEEIATFCSANYGVSFPMMSKVSVKGNDMAPIYQYLTNGEQNGLSDAPVKWNFQKFLVNEDGYVEKVISPRTDPESEEVVSWIEGK